MNETDLIARFFAPLAGPAGLGLADDAACLTPPRGCDLVITADALVAGTHFFPDDPPETIAFKALGVNLSDLAAKGASPLGYLLSLALPRDWTEDWLEKFTKGLRLCGRDAGIALLGGDTVSTAGPLTLSITAIGAVPAGKMLRRAGARVGDRLYVTGTIGDSALGLILRRAQAEKTALPQWADDCLVDRYLRPQPRLALRPATDLARAAMDVSDGLIGDLRALMRASNLFARVDLRKIPLSQAARTALAADPSLFETIVTGGDDYEILFAVGPEEAEDFEARARKSGVSVAWIGEAAKFESLIGLDGAPATFARDRYSHV